MDMFSDLPVLQALFDDGLVEKALVGRDRLEHILALECPRSESRTLFLETRYRIPLRESGLHLARLGVRPHGGTTVTGPVWVVGKFHKEVIRERRDPEDEDAPAAGSDRQPCVLEVLADLLMRPRLHDDGFIVDDVIK